MSQTPMERWTPRERREFEAQMIVAQRHERQIGSDVTWRGLQSTILSISEIPSMSRPDCPHCAWSFGLSHGKPRPRHAAGRLQDFP